MSEVKLENIHKSFDNTLVIRDVSLHIADGDFVVFVGPSGCGKSTLLRMIAGLEDISSGKLYIGDTEISDVPPSQRELAMVFQSYALYPHMSVFDNLAFSLKLAKFDKADIDERVTKAADILHINNLFDRLPKQLSGGQRQRVAIGRAIVRQPKVFLFDEPLSNLDAALRSDMRVELAGLHKELGTTMIYVTHDQVEAMTLATKIVVLNAGEIEQVGTPIDLYLKPQSQFVAGFIGSPKMNFLEGAFAEKLGADVCGIRPEHLMIAENGATPELFGRLKHIEMLGADSLCYIDTPEHGTLLLRQEGIYTGTIGQEMPLVLPDGHRHLFKNGARI